MAKEILIADSDKVEQEEFKSVFKETDYRLVFSEDGDNTLLRLKLFQPDIIIAGKSSKGKGGLDVFKTIKADPELKHIPVVLLSYIFEEISEEKGQLIWPDGILTKPFHNIEILNLIDRLVEREEMKAKGEDIIGKGIEWESIADDNRKNSREKEHMFDEIGEMEDEEIIDLVDVVEEPEQKMSIDDFLAPEIEEPSVGITPLESWEKQMEEEKPADKRFKFAPDEKEKSAKGLSLQLGDEVVSSLEKEVPEKELFNKAALEEILQKVEKLQPAIAEEWPPEEIKKAKGISKEMVSDEKVMPETMEPPEKYEGLAEFEAALKKGLGIELLEEKPQPFFEEGFREAFKKEEKEKPTKEFKEERLAEASDEVSAEATSTEISLEEELEEVQKEFSESLLGELQKEETGASEEPEEKEIDIFEGIDIPEVEEIEEEENLSFEEPVEEEIEILKEEMETPEIFAEEMSAFEEPKEEQLEIFEEIGKFEEPKEEGIEILEEVMPPEVTVPIFQTKEILPPLRTVERQMEDIISKGAREMMEGFITKLVPEITEGIINLTIERIERMVKEIVPEIAEKMIRQEIKRLQNGEKD